MSMTPIIVISLEFLAYYAVNLLILRKGLDTKSDTKKKRVNSSDSHSELDDVFLDPEKFL